MILEALRKKSSTRMKSSQENGSESCRMWFGAQNSTQPSFTRKHSFLYGLWFRGSVPADLKFGAPRLIFENIVEAEATRLEDVDIIEEERLNIVIQSARYQQTLRRYHDRAIRHRSFAVGDLVLHRILTGEGRHKLSPLWEGPFIVIEVTRPGSYRLTQMDGTEIRNSWNIEHLRKFYPQLYFKSYRDDNVLCKMGNISSIKRLQEYSVCS